MLRPRDLAVHRIARQYLRLAQQRGLIRKIGRGLYVASDFEPGEQHSLVQAAKRVPQGVVCLLSALRYHEITTQAPFEVWLALDRKRRFPKVEYPSLHIVRFSGRMLTFGVETHRVEGVPVRVYGVAKTVTDCFRYRNKIGLDVALEALRDAVRKRRVTMDQLWEAARVCRVSRVMRPYLEAIV